MAGSENLRNDWKYVVELGGGGRTKRIWEVVADYGSTWETIKVCGGEYDNAEECMRAS